MPKSRPGRLIQGRGDFGDLPSCTSPDRQAGTHTYMQARACALVSQCTCAGYAAPTRAVATVATPYHTLIASHTPEQDTLVYGAPAPTAVTGATPQGLAGLLDVG